MKAPVLDCSITAAWFLRDEISPRGDAVLSRVKRVGGSAPGLWWAEFRNVLLVAERRQRLTSGDVAAALTDTAGLDIRLDHTPESVSVLRLARSHRLTVHDALYLELAKRREHPLATLDRRLAKAAAAEGLEVL